MLVRRDKEWDAMIMKKKFASEISALFQFSIKDYKWDGEKYKLEKMLW